MTIRLAQPALCTAAASPAAAAPCSDVADLLAFTSDQTVFPVPSTCPEISRSAALTAAPALRSQVGAFVSATGQILLAPDLDPASVLGRSYLLHERVHAAQYRAGEQRRVACEAEAYRLQSSWLRGQVEFCEAMFLDWAAGHSGIVAARHR